jgi:hypothetical protein
MSGFTNNALGRHPVVLAICEVLLDERMSASLGPARRGLFGSRLPDQLSDIVEKRGKPNKRSMATTITHCFVANGFLNLRSVFL